MAYDTSNEHLSGNGEERVPVSNPKIHKPTDAGETAEHNTRDRSSRSEPWDREIALSPIRAGLPNEDHQSTTHPFAFGLPSFYAFSSQDMLGKCQNIMNTKTSIFFVQLITRQAWQPYPVKAQSAEIGDDTDRQKFWWFRAHDNNDNLKVFRKNHTQLLTNPRRSIHVTNNLLGGSPLP